MLVPKVWIPILIVLLAVVFSGLLYSQKTHQDAVKIIKPVAAKPPPPGETAESGHWHGDHWHAAPPHETPVAQPIAQRQEAVLPDTRMAFEMPLGLSESHKQLLLALPETTVYDRVFKTFVMKHFEKYPDCTEHAAVLADAKLDTDWFMEHKIYMEKYWELDAELTDIMDEFTRLLEKYNHRPVYEATHIPEAERLKDIERGQTLMAEMEAHDERSAALKREEPVYPKPKHTH